MFGTDDVIYVPEGSQLIFDDVYHWRRVKFDIRNAGLHVRPAAVEHISGNMRAALGLVMKSPRFSDSAAQIRLNAEEILRDIAATAGSPGSVTPGSLPAETRNESAHWWVRVTDLPAESFHGEDYERPARPPVDAIPHFTYGTVEIAQLDGLHVPLHAEDLGEEEHPFSLELPARGGITRWTIPPTEPLPLVREFCGVHGASAHGRTINITTNATIPDSHQFCTPLGTVGQRLHATLCFHFSFPMEARVMARLADGKAAACRALLEQSGFGVAGEGPFHRIYEREGDVVHFYQGLEGKEAEGVPTMPTFFIVAAAGGNCDPMNRGALFEAIREACG